ncbi:LytR C-terminal domain-containing protein [Corynebacterium phoceense]
MTNVNPETNEKTPAAGLPLRGLAMVLIAVAVALGLWALYSFTRGGNPEPTAADAPVAAQSPQAQQPQPGQAQPSDAPANGQPGTPAEDQGETGTDGTDGAATPGAAAAPAGEGDAAALADGAGEGASASQRKVSILNNSTVQGLAADVSKQVTDAGYELGEVGNFADEILTETTVFFPAGDEVAEAQARTLADKFSGVAKENIQALPAKAMAEGAVTIVLVNQ